MKTIILCGGKGTRIRDVSTELPKPMVKVGRYPILWHIMQHYSHYGYNDFILCLGHLSWEIKKYFLNYKYHSQDFTISNNKKDIKFHNNADELNWSVTMAETGDQTQTGGRIYKIKRYVEDDDLVMLTYGDGLSNVDISKLVEFHKSHNKMGSVTGVRPSGRFGEIEIGERNLINAFNEKPQITSGRINGGFFVFTVDKLWKYLSDDDSLIFEQEPLRHMTEDGELMMFPHDGFWQPMDTFREYKLLNDIWEKGLKEKNVPWFHHK